MNDSKIAAKLRAQLKRFLGELLPIFRVTMGFDPIVNAKYTKSGMLYQSSCINEL